MQTDHMVLKEINCVQNGKIRSNGLERSQLSTQYKIKSNGLERSQLGTQYKMRSYGLEMRQLGKQ